MAEEEKGGGSMRIGKKKMGEREERVGEGKEKKNEGGERVGAMKEGKKVERGDAYN